jgi:hypothetical protein
VINDIFGKSGLKSAENECDFDLLSLYWSFTIWCNFSNSSGNFSAFQFADHFRMLFMDSQELLVQFSEDTTLVLAIRASKQW